MPIEYINTSTTFIYTGTPQTWTVPDNVTSVFVDAYGASGRFGGGKGGRVQADVTVGPEETLYIYVGGRGQGIEGGF